MKIGNWFYDIYRASHKSFSLFHIQWGWNYTDKVNEIRIYFLFWEINITRNETKMKIGDTVKMSNKNLNHLRNDTCAYSGMEGTVTDVWDDNAFALNCGTSTLVIPMNDAFKRRKKGVWIWLNGEHVFHKSISTDESLSWFAQFKK